LIDCCAGNAGLTVVLDFKRQTLPLLCYSDGGDDINTGVSDLEFSFKGLYFQKRDTL